jgi:uncharacterized protein YndB with AHSA1/START domain
VTEPQFELVLERTFDAPPEKVFKAWTTPELLKQWFVPRPWTIAAVEQDLRPGGLSRIVMRNPEGQDFDNPGVFLEIVPNRKLVFTDAFAPGWIPTGQPFMVAHVTFEPLDGGRTKYVARAMHWTAEAKAQHEAMGFHTGWGACADQLAEVLPSI